MKLTHLLTIPQGNASPITWPTLGCVGLFMVVAYFLGAPYWGDTAYYVHDIIKADSLASPHLWEAGHLLWRPLVYILTLALPDSSQNSSYVTSLLIGLNLFSGAVVIVYFYKLLSQYVANNQIIWCGCLALSVSVPFINYSQTGTPYIPGLACLLIGTDLLLTTCRQSKLNYSVLLASSLFYAASVGLWFPYIISLPGFATASVVLHRWNRKRLIALILCGITTSIVISSLYLYASITLNIQSISSFMDWFRNATHGKIGHGGIARTIFGFAESFVHMNEAGKMFKRFLLNDPLNPVPIVDIVSLGAIKLGGCYIFVLCVVLALCRNTHGRRLLLVTTFVAIPNLLFAIMFDGGSLERYLTIHIWLLFCVTFILSQKHLPLYFRLLPTIALLCAIANNAPQISHARLLTQESAVRLRLENLSSLPSEHTLLIVMTLADEVMATNKGFLFSPSRPFPPLNVYPVVMVGTTQAQHWKSSLLTRLAKALKEDTTVWVSTRLLKSQPLVTWGWVEGEDPNVTWKDLNTLFNEFTYNTCLGGKDGFCQLNLPIIPPIIPSVPL